MFSNLACCLLALHHELRLVILTLLNCKMDNFMVIIALVCSSFVTVSAGTHMRAPWSPLGRAGIPFVDLGNLLASRLLGKEFLYGSILYFLCFRFWASMGTLLSTSYIYKS